MSLTASPIRRSGRAWHWLTTVVVAASATAGYELYRHRMPERFAVVAPKILYRSAQPTKSEINNLIREFGVRTILIVRDGESRHVPDEKQYAESRGIKVVHIPIKSRREISDDEVKTFFRYVDDPQSQPVLVHCSAGLHRTGFLTALYRIERQGWSIDRAEKEMLSFGFEKDTQIAVLKQLRQHIPGSFGKAGTVASGSQPVKG